MTARKQQQTTGVRGKFPLGTEQYLSTPSTSRRAVTSGAVAQMVNESLGIEGDQFTNETRAALMAKQDELGMPVTGIVDEATWDVLAGGEVSKPEASDD